MPEIAVLGLPENDEGEIALDDVTMIERLLTKCDCIVAGPAMSDPLSASELAQHLLGFKEVQMVLDAAILMELRDHAEQVKALENPAILTPHVGEMAALLGRPVTPEALAQALRYLIDAEFVTGQMIAVDSGQHLSFGNAS